MELTQLLKIPYPSEHEENYFPVFKNGMAQIDAIQHALGENDNIRYSGGGTFSWSTGTNILSWTAQINVHPLTNIYKGTIALSSVLLEDGDILFFRMFRQLTGDVALTLMKAKRVMASPTRLNDLIAFAARIGNIIYLPDGKTLISGNSGVLFGTGLGSSGSTNHVHETPFKIPGLLVAQTAFNIGFTTPQLIEAHFFRNGLLQFPPDDYTLNPATGLITLVQPVDNVNEKFVIHVTRTP